MGGFFHFLEAIPIQRSGFDRQAFATAGEALQQGHNLLMFPEGTRRPIGKPGPVRSGLGILVAKTSAPVQPVFVRGTCHLEPGGSDLSPLEVRFGPVVTMHALPVLMQRHDARTVNQLISRLFEGIYWELQTRSCAQKPLTEWEQTTGARQERAYRAKTHRLFGNRETT
jgi:long-chain acyl-CoA synthetase